MAATPPDFQKADRINFQHPNATDTVNFTGTISVEVPVTGRTTFVFVEKLEGDTAGFFKEEKNMIVIESGHNVRETEAICDHEMTHLMYGYYHKLPLDKSQDPIYRYSDEQDIRVCDWLALKTLQESP